MTDTTTLETKSAGGDTARAFDEFLEAFDAFKDSNDQRLSEIERRGAADVLTRSEFPYMTFGQTAERDWSTGTEPGLEHTITLHVWSRGRGRKEADEVMAAAQSALHDAALSLTGHRLVNLRHEFSDARRDPDGESFHGISRYRAVTEPV